MKILSNLLAQIHYSASLNMSGREAVFLLLLAGLAWMMGRKKPMVLCAYSIFLILYITLLRRAPGYNEQIHLHLRFWPEAGVWAGNLLNLFLYIPFGWSFVQWKRKSGVWQILLTGFVLSVFCEALQYVTGRGWADVNDVVFNVLGMDCGAWIYSKRSCHWTGSGTFKY